MNKKSWAFFSALVVAAVASLFLTSRDLATLTPGAFLGLGTFVALGVMSEAMALDFQIGSPKQATSSVAYLPMFACALTFPAFWAISASVCVVALSDIIFHRRALWVIVFNASQYAIAISVAIAAYHAFGGGLFAEERLSLPAFFALAAVYFSVNVVIVAGFLALRQHLEIRRVLYEIIGPTGSNLFYDLLASPIAVFSAWLYVRLHVAGVLIGVLPLLLVRYSNSSAVQYRKLSKDLVRVLIKAIETRDPYTSGHSLRVSALARAIAEDLRLRKQQVERVETAALLHDIGKIEALYASIISKPHELTAGERAVIQTHATKGAEMLMELSAFQHHDIIAGVRHHHERFDGTGYPEGLSGTHIPLSARIIMICDALDAMLSDRPYRPALDMESVRAELMRCAGRQFDPEIVKIILESGTIHRAWELVRQQPPDAMARPTLVAATAAS